ncbi:MAG: hypothetical protein K2I38_01795, partial [Duncaniella sp.]|nr:hypothetical protein [Duncaniella sp.]
MRLSNLLVGASIAGALLTACTTDEITIPKSELYAREFIKKFGVIDPNRDLNSATHAGINVVTTRPTDVKVYADINGKRYLFAEGHKLSGTTPLTFDVPKSVKEVIVDAGGQKIKASLGSTVRVSAPHKNVSRTINGSESDWTTEDGLTWKIAPEEKYSTLAVLSYLGTYPENKNNIPNGLNSFYFIADGKPHTFYPFYWYTIAQHCLGIYVVDPDDEDKITLHDLYYSKSGELMVSNDYKPEIDVITHYAGTSRLVAMNNNNTELPEFITYSGPGADKWGGWLEDLGIEPYGNNYAETQIREFGEDSPFKTEHGYISKISYIYYENKRVISFYEIPYED